MRYSRRSFLSITAGAVVCPAVASAQAYPSRPVHLVVGFPPGGAADIGARIIGQYLTERLGQPFIIENRPGVAGNLGTEAVAKSAADGYTLLLVLDTPLTVNPSLYTKLPFDPERDLEPISLIASFSQMLVVHPSVAANSLEDFVAAGGKAPVVPVRPETITARKLIDCYLERRIATAPSNRTRSAGRAAT